MHSPTLLFVKRGTGEQNQDEKQNLRAFPEYHAASPQRDSHSIPMEASASAPGKSPRNRGAASHGRPTVVPNGSVTLTPRLNQPKKAIMV